MAKRTSVLARSKIAETRVARFLWGPDAARDWKELHDVSGPDAEGRIWIGEIKSHAWPIGPLSLWSLMTAALEQAEKQSNFAFAVLIPPHCEEEAALCMRRISGQPVIEPLLDFKQRVIVGQKQAL